MSDHVDIAELERDKARAKARLTNAYHRTFETTDGQLVLEHLREKFGSHFPVFLQNKDGGYCPIQAALRDGQRMALLHIELILKDTKPDGNTQQPTVQVIT